MKAFYLSAFLAAAVPAAAQTVYNYTIPGSLQSVNSFTQFAFPATPPTTGDATLTLQWAACHQSGFGGSSITLYINTSTGWQSIYYNNSNYLECTFIPVSVTIPGAMMADAIATGGGTVQMAVDCDDSCQAGVGCSGLNDPTVAGITLNYTAHAANFSADDAGVCPGTTVHFTDASINTPSSYEWIFPGGIPASSTLQNPVVQYSTSGSWDVTLIVETADGMDTLLMTNYITVHDLPLANAGVDEDMCAGEGQQLQAGGGVSYQWFPATGLNSDVIAGPIATPVNTTSYTVLVTDANGCQASDFMILTVHQLPDIQASAGNNTICLGDTANIVAVGAQLYSWSPNLFISNTSGASVDVWPTSTFTWNVHGTDFYGCANDGSVTITVEPPPPAPTATNT
ncbi:MAG TPA: PKD domain-containing protein, partial [Flavobacteriales bacterium]|nr:PKD domain-containing protein [Flavobacteriales bacterium]